jgi:hypothetical protein
MSDLTLHKIEEAIIRHRMDEAAMLAEMTAKVLRAINSIAGPGNGLGHAVDQRANDAMTLGQTIRRNAAEYLRPDVDVKQVVDRAHAAKVKAAREVA